MMLNVRYPAVAGMFYPSDPDSLKKQIEECFLHALGPGSLPQPSQIRRKKSIGFIAPHAGYMFSGPIAAHVYYNLALEGKPDTIVIIGPNHTGQGSLVSVMVKGTWITPLGDIQIDSQLATEIVKESTFADIDDKAHLLEHSIEVHLPFIQYVFNNADLRFVPIVMLNQEISVAKDIASAIIKASEKLGRDIVLIASTDFSHYEPHDMAVKKDKIALDAILKLDPELLESVIHKYNISMCGPGPTMTLIFVSKKLGSHRAELLAYATSGDVSGDKTSVVGYAAVRVPYEY